MPVVTDWIMIGITAVYVVATLFICKANIRSSHLANQQLAEMKRQYEESNRPIIEVEFTYIRRTWFFLRFVNHGKRAAEHVKILLQQESIDALPNENIKSLLRKQKDKECIIGVDQHYDLSLGSSELRGCGSLPVVGKILYESYNQHYESDFYIDLDNYMTFFSVTTEHDNLMKVLNDVKSEIRGVKEALEGIASGQE